METWPMWVAIPLLLAAVALIGWRWSRMTRRTLSTAESRELAEALAGEIFAVAPGPGSPVPLDPALAATVGKRTLIDLSRWMNGHGYVTTGDWGFIDIVLGEPPRTMALTRREYDKRVAAPHTNTTAGDGSIINNNYGGVQVVAGGDITLSADLLVELSAAVRRDADALAGLERREALVAAQAITDAAEGTLDRASPRFHGALDWLREQVTGVTTGALGSGLWAATAATMSRIGS